MSNHNQKLQHQAGQEQTHLARQTSDSRALLEFNTAEDAIRHDAAQTELPPAIAERLKKSIEQEAVPPKRSWWRRLFGE